MRSNKKEFSGTSWVKPNNSTQEYFILENISFLISTGVIWQVSNNSVPEKSVVWLGSPGTYFPKQEQGECVGP